MLHLNCQQNQSEIQQEGKVQIGSETFIAQFQSQKCISFQFNSELTGSVIYLRTESKATCSLRS